MLTSKPELGLHRQRLKRQRQARLLKACWQMLALSAAVAALLVTFRLPFWLIKNSEAVQIRGNQRVKTDFILDQIPIQYPVSLLNIHPAHIAARLESSVPIVRATVTRKLWPATLRIEVQERQPVALTIPGPVVAAANANGQRPTDMGILDAVGTWLPLMAYQTPNSLSEQVPLRVLGFRLQEKNNWPMLYQEIRSSPVKISTIDWQSAQNMILETDLGSVYMGAYTPRFAAQLRTLDQLRQLSTKVDPKQVEYIDLSNPSVPAVHLKRSQGESPKAPN